MLTSETKRIDPNQRNTLGLSSTQYTRLLERLDEVGAACAADNTARVYRRLAYAHPKVMLSVETEGHATKDIVVATRNLSQGGVSVLHSSFMYNKTRVTAHLPDHAENIKPLRGRVTRCEHRGGVLHEIGIMFDKEIRLREYLTPQHDTLVHSHENVKPEELESSVLFVADDADFGALVRQALLATKIKHTFAVDAAGAIEGASKHAIIAVYHDPKNLQAPSTVAQIRDSGFLGPVVLLGNPESEAQKHIMHACGADMLIHWPCDSKTLVCGLAEYILNTWTHESLRTIRACVGPDIKRALSTEISVLGVRLDQAIRTKDTAAVRTTLMLVNQTATVLEFRALANTAETLSKRLAAGEPIASAADELAEISAMCGVAQSRAA